MTQAPRPPVDQRSAADKGAQPRDEALSHDRRDQKTGVQSNEPGDADVNLDEEGRFGNIRQNLTHQNKTGNR